MKKVLILCLTACLFIVCGQKEESGIKMSADSLPTFSFEEAGVTLPSPASVRLNPGGRFYSRFQGNINYLRYQHDHYGEFMLESFATRHYSPGKQLERAWDGEYAGKWLDAATRVAVNSGNKAQIAMVDAFATSLRQYQQPGGYLGIELPQDRDLDEWEIDWDLWCQWNGILGLLTHYELRHERASLETAAKIGDWVVRNYGPIKDKEFKFFYGRISGGFTRVVLIGQLVRLYRHTGKEDYLDFVGQVIQHYPPIQKMLTSGEPFLMHPYMLNAVLLGVLEYARETKDSAMLAKVEQVWDGLVNDHLFPTGSLGDREDLDEDPLRDTPNGQLQETCATTEWIFLTQGLYETTGRAKYAEALELTCYNALIAAQSVDGMKWCYWTPLRYSKHFLYGPTRCCYWSGPKGMARLPQLIYANKGNDVYVNFFESSQAVINTDGGEVHIKQQSQYPGIGNSLVSIKTPRGWHGRLRIRVPSWARDFQVKLNGKMTDDNQNESGYSTVQLENSRAYRIEIRFDVPLNLDKFEGKSVAIRRGPEVLSIDARDNVDTWLGQHDELVTIPEEIKLLPLDPKRRFQWPGPTDTSTRRRYHVKLNDRRAVEPLSFILTPYSDAGNENAAFRTVFPLE